MKLFFCWSLTLFFFQQWCQERLLDEMKMEDGEEGEVDDHGIAISIRRVRNLTYFTIFM